ncbi:uncharacterized protein EAE98_006420 [Botrytis deweyae]|uniref:Cytochrome P450 n=1 Tax=Botrytis deweyae TaxID=2478750 RepID=A0ABQ7IKU8_9HELO|nr:uncharacterized protein EAE98_006420 [Botrytis deweyae]KAF7927036.1 hypothetical protein EAE98_006420 [Botrytis deweyae]
MSPALFDESRPMAMSLLFLGALALVILAYFIRAILSRPQKLDFPLVGKPGSVNWHESFREGAARVERSPSADPPLYPNTPFTLPSDPPVVVLPHCTNEEVRLFPKENTSFWKEIESIFYTAHIFGRGASVVVKIVKTDLICYVVSITDCIKAKNTVVEWPAWTRYFVALFLPEIKKVQWHMNKAADLLRLLIDGCIRRFSEGKGLGGESGDGFEDDQGAFVIWMMKHTSPELRENPHNLVSLTKLKKLDSLLKESQRLSPPTASLRVTTTPLHLSTGHTIPKGTSVEYDSHAIELASPNISLLHHDSSTMPKLDPPNVFSPFYFSSPRETPGNQSKYQYVTTSKDSINFGHGNHAFPGRFFAGVELKVVIVELLRN